MSQWPEPTHDESEPPRWGKWGALVGIVAVLVVGANSNMFGSSWRLPAFAMPEFNMPEFSLPDMSDPSSSDAPASVAIAESPTFDPLAEPTTTPDGATVQSMPFDSCVRTLESMADSFGQDIALVEDTPDRRVANFKFIDSRLTVICSRAEGTMTVQR